MEGPLAPALATLLLALTGATWGRQVSGQGITAPTLLASVLGSGLLLAFLVWRAAEGASLLWLAAGVLGNLLGALWVMFRGQQQRG